MRAVAACSLLALAGCPYDPSAAGLTQVDGGYTYQVGDGSVFIPAAAVTDADVPEVYGPAPDTNTLCMLVIGDILDQNEWPHRYGTWIGDVKTILGEPTRNSLNTSFSAAQLTYQWRNGGLELSFEKVPIGSGTAKPFPDPFFVNGITVRSPLQFLDCWDFRYAATAHTTPCPQCQFQGDVQ